MSYGLINGERATEALTRLGPLSPNWKRVSPELRLLLENYPDVHRREMRNKEKGRFVFARADNHGIGNRVNCVISAFAVALLTNRALVMSWDSRHTCPENPSIHKLDVHGHNRTAVEGGIGDVVCDPVRVNDLFDAPGNIDWLGESLPSKMKINQVCNSQRLDTQLGSWVFKNNQDFKGFYDLFDANYSTFSRDRTVLCVHSDRPFFWAATCNPSVRHIFPDPWSTFGLLQDYLLLPTKILRDRIQDQLSGKTCLAGIHLRLKKPASIHYVTAGLADILKAGAPRKSDGIFIASDPYSLRAKEEIVRIVNASGHRLIESKPFTPIPTRATIEGLLDATVENSILSTCDRIFPYDTGKSTYHDIAVARMIWRRRPKRKDIQIMLGDVEERRDGHPMPAPRAICFDPRKKNSENVSF